MQLHQLRYVLTAARLKNFSKAARELYISQPTLSQQIINLEEELGISLFIRHSKSVSLTAAGEEFVLYAERIMNDIDNLKESMEKHRTMAKGSLKLGVPWIIGYLSLSDEITKFTRKYSDIDVTIKVNGSKKLLEMLYNREVDAIFMLGTESDFQESEVSYKRIIDDRFMVIVSLQNPLASRSALSVRDLGNEKIIMPAPDSSIRQMIESRFYVEGITPNIICESSQSDVSIQLASSGFGIAFSSESIANALDNHMFKAIPLIPALDRTIYYVTLKTMAGYPTVSALSNYIRFIYEAVELS